MRMYSLSVGAMTKEEAFEFLDRTAKGIAEMFGASCETLVHDMGNPSHPILTIYNLLSPASFLFTRQIYLHFIHIIVKV